MKRERDEAAVGDPVGGFSRLFWIVKKLQVFIVLKKYLEGNWTLLTLYIFRLC